MPALPLSELSSAVQRSRRRWYWMPVAVLALGVLSIALLVTADLIRTEQLVQRSELRHAVDQIKTDLATAHLWLEEYLTGDPLDVDKVWDNLDHSRELIDTIVVGGEISQGRRLNPLPPASTLRQQAERVRDQIGRFREISHDRQRGFLEARDVGIGSEVDSAYDAAFNELLADLSSMSIEVEHYLDSAHDNSELIFRTILLAWIVIVVVAVWGLWSHEKRRVEIEKTLDESRAQLLQAQKMDAVGQLAGGIAHDVNNYLAAIKIQGVLTKRKPDDSVAVVDSMGVVLDCVDKVKSMIERLLAFSRRQPLEPRTIDLNEVVVGLEKMIHGLIGDDVLLETDLDDDLWPVKSDRTQLEQVVLNLVVNARDAMPRGGSITIETRNVAGEGMLEGTEGLGDRVLLAVTDSGPGIPEALHGKIFEPFFTTKGQANSSGLGLATVYGVVKQYGGDIRLESGPGRGARFEIRLPKSSEPRSRRVGPEPVERQAIAGTERLLLVEDNDQLRLSASIFLEEIGYAVLAAASGEEALEVFEASGGAIDVMVADVVMPGLSGRELADRLLVVRPDLPIIFVSGYADGRALRYGMRDDGVDYLQKPFEPHDLAARIRRVLDG